ncbi:MAG: 3-methyladenine DNA glycosylase [Actinophytocola sp.]|nr:3-methyladenine DNA glycosylase [Actinophytocola sp.]
MTAKHLPEREWRALATAHRDRMRVWTEPHRARKARGEPHPVLDFLFTYYSHRPSLLERWHPGPSRVLAGEAAREFLRREEYIATGDGVRLDLTRLSANRLGTVRFIRSLLRATADRPARLNCFGLHEWAMVYRLPDDEVRHAGVPLRLGGAATDDVVESLDIRCSHYDAFRFFTESATRRNALSPTRATQRDHEQPGCLHANMDIYKWAYKLYPYVPAELVADCFELAAAIREIDMRASPYDLSDYGYQAIRIETPDGRAEYVRTQATFARRAAPLRNRLVEVCDILLADSEL